MLDADANKPWMVKAAYLLRSRPTTEWHPLDLANHQLLRSPALTKGVEPSRLKMAKDGS